MFNQVQVTNICRTCLGLDGPFLPIYENKPCEHPYGCLADLLCYTLNINTSKTDKLSQVVCEDCNKEINRSYSFKIKCENSNKLYRDLFHIPDDADHEQAVVKIDTDAADQEQLQRQFIPHSMQVCQQTAAMDESGGRIINKTKEENDFRTDFEFRVDLKDSISIEEPQLVMELLNATINNGSQQERREIRKSLPNSNPYKCSKCQKAYPSPEHLSLHFCNKIVNQSLDPLNTSINTSNESNLKDPSAKPKQSSELCCPTCGKKYLLLYYLQKHMKTHNCSQKIDVTMLCGVVQSGSDREPQGGLEQHVQSFSEVDENSQTLAEPIRKKSRQDIQAYENLCTCSKCKRTFSSISQLCIHDCNQSNNKSVKQSGTNPENNLKKPESKANNSFFRYICLECGKNYQLLYYLKKHMKTHKSLSNARKKQLIDQTIEMDKAKTIIYDKNFEPQKLPENMENDAINNELLIDKHGSAGLNDNRLHRHTCSKCQRDFPSQKELGTHDCNKILNGSTNQADAKVSSNENTSGKSYQSNGDNKSCSICGKKYQLLFYLRKHMKSHSFLPKKKKPATTIHRDLQQPLPSHSEENAAKGLENSIEDESPQNQITVDKNNIQSIENTPLRHSRRKIIQTTRMRNYLEEQTSLQRNTHPKEKANDEMQTQTNAIRRQSTTTKKDSNILPSDIGNESLQQKVLPEMENNRICCPHCGRTMPNNMALKMHIRRNICSQKFHTCSLCKKVFNSARNLRLHVQKHYEDNDLERFPCTEPNCNKSFIKSKTLREHMDTHNKKPSFFCLKCDKGFHQMKYLKCHLLRHSSKRYKCQSCTRTFCNRSELNAHTKQYHSDGRSLACELCDKTFSCPKGIREHKRLHTGEMPYGCNVCQQRFAFRGSLTRHISKHSC